MGGAGGKESTCQCRRHRFNPWVRKIPWSRKWHPTPLFLPGEFHGQRSLVGQSQWSHKESDTTERMSPYCTKLLSSARQSGSRNAITILLFNTVLTIHATFRHYVRYYLKMIFNVIKHVKVKVLVTQSCPTLCHPMVCPWDSPSRNTGVGCHSLLQGIFLT